MNNSYSNYKFKKEVAQVPNEESKAHAKVNKIKNKKFRPNQAVGNLKIKLQLLQLTIPQIQL